MLEKFVANLIVPYLSHYFESIDQDQLNINIWNGKAELRNLTLKKDVLERLLREYEPLLPPEVSGCGRRIRVHKGACRLARLTIPFKSLRSSPASLEMVGVYLTVSIHDSTKKGVEEGPGASGAATHSPFFAESCDADDRNHTESTSHLKAAWWARLAARKERQLEEVARQVREERGQRDRRRMVKASGLGSKSPLEPPGRSKTAGAASTSPSVTPPAATGSSTSAPGGSAGKEQQTFFQRLGELVLHNIHVSIDDIHCRFELKKEAEKGAGQPAAVAAVAGGLSCEKLRWFNVDEVTGEAGFVDPQLLTRSAKRLFFTGAEVYVEGGDLPSASPTGGGSTSRTHPPPLSSFTLTSQIGDPKKWEEAMRERTMNTTKNASIIGPVKGSVDVRLRFQSHFAGSEAHPYADVRGVLDPCQGSLNRAQYLSVLMLASRLFSTETAGFSPSSPGPAITSTPASVSPAESRSGEVALPAPPALITSSAGNVDNNDDFALLALPPARPSTSHPIRSGERARMWWRYAIRVVRLTVSLPKRRALLQRFSEKYLIRYEVLFHRRLQLRLSSKETGGTAASAPPESEKDRRDYTFLQRYMALEVMRAGRLHVYARLAAEGREVLSPLIVDESAGSTVAPPPLPRNTSEPALATESTGKGWRSWFGWGASEAKPSGQETKQRNKEKEMAAEKEERELLQELAEAYGLQSERVLNASPSIDASPRSPQAPRGGGEEGGEAPLIAAPPPHYCWIHIWFSAPAVRFDLDLSSVDPSRAGRSSKQTLSVQLGSAELRAAQFQHNEKQAYVVRYQVASFQLTHPWASSEGTRGGAGAKPSFAYGVVPRYIIDSYAPGYSSPPQARYPSHDTNELGSRRILDFSELENASLFRVIWEGKEEGREGPRGLLDIRFTTSPLESLCASSQSPSESSVASLDDVSHSRPLGSRAETGLFIALHPLHFFLDTRLAGPVIDFFQRPSHIQFAPALTVKTRHVAAVAGNAASEQWKKAVANAKSTEVVLFVFCDLAAPVLWLPAFASPLSPNTAQLHTFAGSSQILKISLGHLVIDTIALAMIPAAAGEAEPKKVEEGEIEKEEEPLVVGDALRFTSAARRESYSEYLCCFDECYAELTSFSSLDSDPPPTPAAAGREAIMENEKKEEGQQKGSSDCFRYIPELSFEAHVQYNPPRSQKAPSTAAGLYVSVVLPAVVLRLSLHHAFLLKTLVDAWCSPLFRLFTEHAAFDAASSMGMFECSLAGAGDHRAYMAWLLGLDGGGARTTPPAAGARTITSSTTIPRPSAFSFAATMAPLPSPPPRRSLSATLDQLMLQSRGYAALIATTTIGTAASCTGPARSSVTPLTDGVDTEIKKSVAAGGGEIGASVAAEPRWTCSSHPAGSAGAASSYTSPSPPPPTAAAMEWTVDIRAEQLAVHLYEAAEGLPVDGSKFSVECEAFQVSYRFSAHGPAHIECYWASPRALSLSGETIVGGSSGALLYLAFASAASSPPPPSSSLEHPPHSGSGGSTLDLELQFLPGLRIVIGEPLVKLLELSMDLSNVLLAAPQMIVKNKASHPSASTSPPTKCWWVRRLEEDDPVTAAQVDSLKAYASQKDELRYHLRVIMSGGMSVEARLEGVDDPSAWAVKEQSFFRFDVMDIEIDLVKRDITFQVRGSVGALKVWEVLQGPPPAQPEKEENRKKKRREEPRAVNRLLLAVHPKVTAENGLQRVSQQPSGNDRKGETLKSLTLATSVSGAGTASAPIQKTAPVSAVVCSQSVSRSPSLSSREGEDRGECAMAVPTVHVERSMMEEKEGGRKIMHNSSFSQLHLPLFNTATTWPTLVSSFASKRGEPPRVVGEARSAHTASSPLPIPAAPASSSGAPGRLLWSFLKHYRFRWRSRESTGGTRAADAAVEHAEVLSTSSHAETASPPALFFVFDKRVPVMPVWIPEKNPEIQRKRMLINGDALVFSRTVEIDVRGCTQLFWFPPALRRSSSSSSTNPNEENDVGDESAPISALQSIIDYTTTGLLARLSLLSLRPTYGSNDPAPCASPPVLTAYRVQTEQVELDIPFSSSLAALPPLAGMIELDEAVRGSVLSLKVSNRLALVDEREVYDVELNGLSLWRTLPSSPHGAVESSGLVLHEEVAEPLVDSCSAPSAVPSLGVSPTVSFRFSQGRGVDEVQWRLLSGTPSDLRVIVSFPLDSQALDEVPHIKVEPLEEKNMECGGETEEDVYVGGSGSRKGISLRIAASDASALKRWWYQRFGETQKETAKEKDETPPPHTSCGSLFKYHVSPFSLELLEEWPSAGSQGCECSTASHSGGGAVGAGTASASHGELEGSFPSHSVSTTSLFELRAERIRGTMHNDGAGYSCTELRWNELQLTHAHPLPTGNPYAGDGALLFTSSRGKLCYRQNLHVVLQLLFHQFGGRNNAMANAGWWHSGIAKTNADVEKAEAVAEAKERAHEMLQLNHFSIDLSLEMLVIARKLWYPLYEWGEAEKLWTPPASPNPQRTPSSPSPSSPVRRANRITCEISSAFVSLFHPELDRLSLEVEFSRVLIDVLSGCTALPFVAFRLLSICVRDGSTGLTLFQSLALANPKKIFKAPEVRQEEEEEALQDDEVAPRAMEMPSAAHEDGGKEEEERKANESTRSPLAPRASRAPIGASTGVREESGDDNGSKSSTRGKEGRKSGNPLHRIDDLAEVVQIRFLPPCILSKKLRFTLEARPYKAFWSAAMLRFLREEGRAWERVWASLGLGSEEEEESMREEDVTKEKEEDAPSLSEMSKAVYISLEHPQIFLVNSTSVLHAWDEASHITTTTVRPSSYTYALQFKKTWEAVARKDIDEDHVKNVPHGKQLQARRKRFQKVEFLHHSFGFSVANGEAGKCLALVAYRVAVEDRIDELLISDGDSLYPQQQVLKSTLPLWWKEVEVAWSTDKELVKLMMRGEGASVPGAVWLSGLKASYVKTAGSMAKVVVEVQQSSIRLSHPLLHHMLETLRANTASPSSASADVSLPSLTAKNPGGAESDVYDSLPLGVHVSISFPHGNRIVFFGERYELLNTLQVLHVGVEAHLSPSLALLNASFFTGDVRLTETRGGWQVLHLQPSSKTSPQRKDHHCRPGEALRVHYTPHATAAEAKTDAQATATVSAGTIMVLASPLAWSEWVKTVNALVACCRAKEEAATDSPLACTPPPAAVTPFIHLNVDLNLLRVRPKFGQQSRGGVSTRHSFCFCARGLHFHRQLENVAREVGEDERGEGDCGGGAGLSTHIVTQFHSAEVCFCAMSGKSEAKEKTETSEGFDGTPVLWGQEVLSQKDDAVVSCYDVPLPPSLWVSYRTVDAVNGEGGASSLLEVLVPSIDASLSFDMLVDMQEMVQHFSQELEESRISSNQSQMEKEVAANGTKELGASSMPSQVQLTCGHVGCAVHPRPSVLPLFLLSIDLPRIEIDLMTAKSSSTFAGMKEEVVCQLWVGPPSIAFGKDGEALRCTWQAAPLSSWRSEQQQTLASGDGSPVCTPASFERVSLASSQGGLLLDIRYANGADSAEKLEDQVSLFLSPVAVECQVSLPSDVKCAWMEWTRAVEHLSSSLACTSRWEEPPDARLRNETGEVVGEEEESYCEDTETDTSLSSLSSMEEGEWKMAKEDPQETAAAAAAASGDEKNANLVGRAVRHLICAVLSGGVRVKGGNAWEVSFQRLSVNAMLYQYDNTAYRLWSQWEASLEALECWVMSHHRMYSPLHVDVPRTGELFPAMKTRLLAVEHVVWKGSRTFLATEIPQAGGDEGSAAVEKAWSDPAVAAEIWDDASAFSGGHRLLNEISFNAGAVNFHLHRAAIDVVREWWEENAAVMGSREEFSSSSTSPLMKDLLEARLFFCHSTGPILRLSEDVILQPYSVIYVSGSEGPRTSYLLDLGQHDLILTGEAACPEIVLEEDVQLEIVNGIVRLPSFAPSLSQWMCAGEGGRVALGRGCECVALDANVSNPSAAGRGRGGEGLQSSLATTTTAEVEGTGEVSDHAPANESARKQWFWSSVQQRTLFRLSIDHSSLLVFSSLTPPTYSSERCSEPQVGLTGRVKAEGEWLHSHTQSDDSMHIKTIVEPRGGWRGSIESLQSTDGGSSTTYRCVSGFVMKPTAIRWNRKEDDSKGLSIQIDPLQVAVPTTALFTLLECGEAVQQCFLRMPSAAVDVEEGSESVQYKHYWLVCPLLKETLGSKKSVLREVQLPVADSCCSALSASPVKKEEEEAEGAAVVAARPVSVEVQRLELVLQAAPLGTVVRSPLHPAPAEGLSRGTLTPTICSTSVTGHRLRIALEACTYTSLSGTELASEVGLSGSVSLHQPFTGVWCPLLERVKVQLKREEARPSIRPATAAVKWWVRCDLADIVFSTEYVTVLQPLMDELRKVQRAFAGDKEAASVVRREQQRCAVMAYLQKNGNAVVAKEAENSEAKVEEMRVDPKSAGCGAVPRIHLTISNQTSLKIRVAPRAEDLLESSGDVDGEGSAVKEIAPYEAAAEIEWARAENWMSYVQTMDSGFSSSSSIISSSASSVNSSYQTERRGEIGGPAGSGCQVLSLNAPLRFTRLNDEVLVETLVVKEKKVIAFPPPRLSLSLLFFPIHCKSHAILCIDNHFPFSIAVADDEPPLGPLERRYLPSHFLLSQPLRLTPLLSAPQPAYEEARPVDPEKEKMEVDPKAPKITFAALFSGTFLFLRSTCNLSTGNHIDPNPNATTTSSPALGSSLFLSVSLEPSTHHPNDVKGVDIEDDAEADLSAAAAAAGSFEAPPPACAGLPLQCVAIRPGCLVRNQLPYHVQIDLTDTSCKSNPPTASSQTMRSSTHTIHVGASSAAALPLPGGPQVAALGLARSTSVRIVIRQQVTFEPGDEHGEEAVLRGPSTLFYASEPLFLYPPSVGPLKLVSQEGVEMLVWAQCNSAAHRGGGEEAMLTELILRSPVLLMNRTPYTLTLRECNEKGEDPRGASSALRNYEVLPPKMRSSLAAAPMALGETKRLSGTKSSQTGTPVSFFARFQASNGFKAPCVPLLVQQTSVIALHASSNRSNTTQKDHKKEKNSRGVGSDGPAIFIAYSARLLSSGSLQVVFEPRWLFVNRTPFTLAVNPVAIPDSFSSQAAVTQPPPNGELLVVAPGGEGALLMAPALPTSTREASSSLPKQHEAFIAAELIEYPHGGDRGAALHPVSLDTRVRAYTRPISIDRLHSRVVLLSPLPVTKVAESPSRYMDVSVRQKGRQTEVRVEILHRPPRPLRDRLPMFADALPFVLLNRSPCLTIHVLVSIPMMVEEGGRASTTVMEKEVGRAPPGYRIPLWLDISGMNERPAPPHLFFSLRLTTGGEKGEEENVVVNSTPNIPCFRSLTVEEQSALAKLTGLAVHRSQRSPSGWESSGDEKCFHPLSEVAFHCVPVELHKAPLSELTGRTGAAGIAPSSPSPPMVSTPRLTWVVDARLLTFALVRPYRDVLFAAVEGIHLGYTLGGGGAVLTADEDREPLPKGRKPSTVKKTYLKPTIESTETTNRLTERYHLQIKNFQVDNQTSLNPVHYTCLLTLRQSVEEDAVNASIQRVLPSLLQKNRTSIRGVAGEGTGGEAVEVLVFDYIRVELKPLLIRASDSFVLALVDWAREVQYRRTEKVSVGLSVGVLREQVIARDLNASSSIAPLPEGFVPKSVVEDPHSAFHAPAELSSVYHLSSSSSSASSAVYIQVHELSIAPLVVRLWWDRDIGEKLVTAIASRGGFRASLMQRMITSFDDVKMIVPPMIISGAGQQEPVRLDVWWSVLLEYYKVALWDQARGIILQYAGSLPLIGVPFQLYRGFSDGTAQLLQAPFAVLGSATTKNGVSLTPLVSGAVDFTTNVVGGGFAALTNLSRTSADLLDCTSGSPSSSGGSSRVDGFVSGLSSGLFGVGRLPVRGAQERGVGGALKGLARGMVGVVTQPVSGLLSDVSRVTDVCSQVLTGRYLPAANRMRSPRIFHRFGSPAVWMSVEEVFEFQRGECAGRDLAFLGSRRWSADNLQMGIDGPAWNPRRREEIRMTSKSGALLTFPLSRWKLDAGGWGSLVGWTYGERYVVDDPSAFHAVAWPEARIRRRRWVLVRATEASVGSLNEWAGEVVLKKKDLEEEEADEGREDGSR